ncbi:pyrimidine operon attenuation protein/uracil phosphoribosyltransferase [Thiohalophilus thiocyanatoxydans]|uniref:Pyrimidine operon attenuation protein/uracil phosphoribosyltransferase n=2 Tax=Thiohalophilus thiocyanatoxydans TaxID=381308 RepID=A0A4R8ISY3_9GAMM|nr:pyrimidine operon attenuation protein/uracil phosphoribosyltransferase [Thiohalophilus thiocyanatoxydans]
MSERRDVQTLLSPMAGDLQSLLNSRHITDPAIIGIHTGGAWIAERIHQQLKPEQPLGTLNITFYRDDFTRIGLHPQVEPSNLPFSVDDRHIVLIDDVLHTGRTIRAAMNEIFDYGRPASIILACLVERSGRELPICADVAGERLTLEAHQHVKLTGPDPLELLIQESK